MKKTRTRASDEWSLSVVTSPLEIDGGAWNDLLGRQSTPGPFMRHEYLVALHASGSASPESGWTPCFLLLRRGQPEGPAADSTGPIVAACPVYLKQHSYGEYVFDWAWANAYQQHGLAYYPKAVVAVPFTPVPGARLLAEDANARVALLRGLVAFCESQELSSVHLLFTAEEDVEACAEVGLMLRHTVQFHWHNATPGYADFDTFLATLAHDKRKKIRQERRKVRDAGVTFRWSRGHDITPGDWDFFYRCYSRTYREHGNAPYLTRDFFKRVAQALPEAWLLFVAEREGRPIASSLIALHCEAAGAAQATDASDDDAVHLAPVVAYGRYWGALERVDCLHFEACYYQPLEWCIKHGARRFEGGAQGEHKMARALMPVRTTSAHWLARPDFASAVERFLEREGEGIEHYMEHLEQRSPFRAPD
ncbi:MAG: GNAT family N-acetyltransferase [Variovorax sp.]